MKRDQEPGCKTPRVATNPWHLRKTDRENLAYLTEPMHQPGHILPHVEVAILCQCHSEMPSKLPSCPHGLADEKQLFTRHWLYAKRKKCWVCGPRLTSQQAGRSRENTFCSWGRVGEGKASLRSAAALLELFA